MSRGLKGKQTLPLCPCPSWYITLAGLLRFLSSPYLPYLEPPLRRVDQWKEPKRVEGDVVLKWADPVSHLPPPFTYLWSSPVELPPPFTDLCSTVEGDRCDVTEDCCSYGEYIRWFACEWKWVSVAAIACRIKWAYHVMSIYVRRYVTTSMGFPLYFSPTWRC